MTVKENGKVNEIIPFNVGFRRIEIKPTEQLARNGKPYVCLFINGQPLKLKGVNIHEHNPATGHYMTEELMRKDFELMKQHNLEYGSPVPLSARSPFLRIVRRIRTLCIR